MYTWTHFFYTSILYKYTYILEYILAMGSLDLDQDIAPIPRSREENQERYVLVYSRAVVFLILTTQCLR